MSTSMEPNPPGDGEPGDGEPDPGELMALARRLYPIRRSLTGPGVTATLAALAEHVPLEVREVPSGMPVLDWAIPREWTLRDAWVETLDGRRVIDLADHPLHVVGHSTPVDAVVDREELLAHLHAIPERPDWIPFRTSYYAEDWGFCAAQRVVDGLDATRYRVRIDADLAPGTFRYGECVLPGAVAEEVLLTTHICHPAMANDNVSGIVVLASLGSWLASAPRRYTYRLLFLPGTLGSIAWLAAHAATLPPIRYGITIAGVGDRGDHAWKRTEAEDSAVDRLVEVALRDAGQPFALRPFSPWGYDERQFNAPGFRLPVGLLSRTPHGTYPEYHTSADDLSFIDPSSLAASVTLLRSIVGIVEVDRTLRNLRPYAEPQLSRYGLYESTGGATDRPPDGMAMLWVLSQGDGTRSLVDIALRSGLPFARLAEAAARLEDAGLVGE